MQVFVLDNNRKPLDPCSPARARYLLKRGRAAIFHRYPFTIILKDRMVEDFLKRKPEVLARIKRQAKAPLEDAAAVNSTRWELFRHLKANTVELAITPLTEGTSGSLSPRGRGLG